MSDKETSGYSARSSQVSIAFEVRGCPRGRKATISSSATKCTSAKSGGNSKGLTSKAKSNFFCKKSCKIFTPPSSIISMWMLGCVLSKSIKRPGNKICGVLAMAPNLISEGSVPS